MRKFLLIALFVFVSAVVAAATARIAEYFEPVELGYGEIVTAGATTTPEALVAESVSSVTGLRCTAP